MRVLFSSNPGYGHLLPLFPLARALRDQGHQVGVVTGAAMVTAIEPEGFEMIPAGPPIELIIAEVARRTGRNPFDGGESAEFEAEFFAGSRVDLSVQEALAGARRFAPDLIVHERADFVGPLVATALGVPHATLNYAPELVEAAASARIATVRSRYLDRGLPAPARTPNGRWLLDTWPASLQVDGIAPQRPQRLALRPEPHQGTGLTSSTAAPGTIAGPSADRPRVLVTFGTIFGSPALVNPLLRTLSELDVDLVVTMGANGKPADFEVDERRVQLVPFVSLAQLLDGVSAIVQHGGAGTTLGGLSRGIPMVIVPQGAGQSIQGDQVAAVGAGLTVLASPDRPAAVAAALRRVLAEMTFATAAHRVRDEIAAMPSPVEVAGQLRDALANSPVS
jgi:UDP:flavonoid glycosyltransferase YjiC (YdhE family)